MDRSANREAVAYFEQALAALAHLPALSRQTAKRAIDLRLDLRQRTLPDRRVERLPRAPQEAGARRVDRRPVTAGCHRHLEVESGLEDRRSTSWRRNRPGVRSTSPAISATSRTRGALSISSPTPFSTAAIGTQPARCTTRALSVSARWLSPSMGTGAAQGARDVHPDVMLEHRAVALSEIGEMTRPITSGEQALAWQRASGTPSRSNERTPASVTWPAARATRRGAIP